VFSEHDLVPYGIPLGLAPGEKPKRDGREVKIISRKVALLSAYSAICSCSSDLSPEVKTVPAEIRSGNDVSSICCSMIAFHSSRDNDDDANIDIYVMDADGGNQTKITNDPGEDSYPSFSPNGQRLLFESNRDGDFEIYTMNIDGTDVVQLTHNDIGEFSASWSPNGGKIAFVSFRDEASEIYLMNSDGTNQTRVTRNDIIDEAPHFSPDGLTLTTESGHDSDTARNRQIWTINIDGSGPRQLTDNAAYNGYPVWSPDGKFITFDSNLGDLDGPPQIYRIESNGQNLTRLTAFPTGATSGPWSWDGTLILFSAEAEDGNRELFTMDKNGENVTRITTNDARAGAPSWSPF